MALINDLMTIVQSEIIDEVVKIIDHALFTIDDWHGVEIITRKRISEETKQRVIDAFINSVSVGSGAMGYEEVRFVDDIGIDRREKIIWNALTKV